jgi:GNAT superfamily N-acetyltransferase
VIVVERVRTLPYDIDVLADAANREGIALVARLVDDYQSGSNRFDREGEGLWASRDDVSLVGVCGLNQDPFATPAERAGRVRRLYVLQPWRRLGVGSLLLDEVEAMALQHHRILTAYTIDPVAAAFYRSRNYQMVTGVTKRSFQLNL